MAILEQGRLEILGYEFGVEIIEDETAFLLDKLKKSQIYTMLFYMRTKENKVRIFQKQ